MKSAAAVLAAILTLAAGAASAQTAVRPLRPASPVLRPLQPPPPRRIASTAPAAPRTLICAGASQQRLDIRLDYSSAKFGVYVDDMNTMTWMPSRNEVRIRFGREPTGADKGLAPGFCAWQDRGVDPSEPDEVGFPVEQQHWQYGQVDGHPMLMPEGSNLDALFTPGTRTRFTVTLKADPMQTGKTYWRAEVPPDVLP